MLYGRFRLGRISTVCFVSRILSRSKIRDERDTGAGPPPQFPSRLPSPDLRSYADDSSWLPSNFTQDEQLRFTPRREEKSERCLPSFSLVPLSPPPHNGTT